MERSSRTFIVSKDTHVALGSPQGDETIKLSEVLRKAGYNP